MNIDAIKTTLNQRFSHLEEITPDFFCATDKYHDKPYAIRYFDLSDNISSRSKGLNEFLENALGEEYFDEERPVDLRWNNYVYFITSDGNQQDNAFLRAKSIIESNREYARKFVITETDLPKILMASPRDADMPAAPMQDLLGTWLKFLNRQQLGYLLDFSLTAPEIVRRVGKGELRKLEQAIRVGELNAPELDSINHPIQNLVKTGFRQLPKDGEFQFGSHVNLITGPNGNGKTSLLEVIEYLYCGSTCRNGKPSTHTNIKASLTDSKETLETDSKKTAPKRLKARNLGWYGKTDVKGNSLATSFARFNFMDTDAAIRVSIEDTSEQLSENITQIVLGAEASKASNQINRINSELEKQFKTDEKEKQQLIEKIHLLQEESEALKAMTKQSDTVFQHLKQHLHRIHWIEGPENADLQSINTLTESLATANHQCKLLEGSNLEDLNKRRLELKTHGLSLLTLVEKVSNLEQELKVFDLRKEEMAQKRKLFEELQTYSGSDLLVLDQKQKELTATINGLKSSLPDLQRIDLIDDQLANLPLEIALSETDTKLTKLRAEKAETLVRVEEREHHQSALEALRDQLISTATKILESSANKDQCPLCLSQFEEGQLMIRVATDVVGDSAPRSVDMRNKLEALKTRVSDLQHTKSLLTSLISYCGDAANVTCTLGLSTIEADQQKLLERMNSLETVTSKITDNTESGREVSRLKELLEYLVITEFTPNKLDGFLQSLHNESTKLTDVISNKKTVLDGTNQQISSLAEKVGLPKSSTAAILDKTITMERKRCDQKIAAAAQLAGLLKPITGFSTIALSHQINEARDMASKLITTLKQEEETNSRSQKLGQQIKAMEESLTEIQATLKHLSQARDAVSKILTGPKSLESIKHDLLTKNTTIISEIFSKIHFPNEYDFCIEDGETKLIHKASGESRKLTEVSSGQRAAFALSLFLTMNKTLDNGPRAMLLDDPISHIDDINMLSFLDYLRELAIDGSRQIFFSTPNTKLASLFRHKFGFLGANEFRELRMTR